ncbi:unnamed protein product [Darwinula stevensoni]|uniref:NADH dehydrogenase [ubiquinone] 1 beta subcomplex subunit 3 n=1 Tax=Darwinula stevensoni TaxID=69355 RepID=A0A7R8XJC1_9CRUS|nr:unnamed protein product [Darwinula stevensoni]CAG0892050.1 unnamed protein product [Darwinula stevensoni]
MGGGGEHGHGHSPIPKVPDYKSFQVGDHTPELQNLQRMLAYKGLKDPWIRNYVWQYDNKKWGPLHLRLFRHTLFRGFKYGLALTAIVIAGEKLWAAAHPSDEHHH